MGFLRSSTSPHVNPCLLILLCNFIYNLKTHVLVKRHLTLRRHFLLVGRRTVDGSQLFPGDCDHEEGGRISTKRLKRVNDVSHDESSGKAVRRWRVEYLKNFGQNKIKIFKILMPLIFFPKGAYTL
jgi:hypothetical protein